MKALSFVGKKATVTVDGVSHETTVTKVDFIGIDLHKFGQDNEWADGKHYSGILKCLSEMIENNTTSESVERKGSFYSVAIEA